MTHQQAIFRGEIIRVDLATNTIQYEVKGGIEYGKEKGRQEVLDAWAERQRLLNLGVAREL